jgi:hypothetical protein
MGSPFVDPQSGMVALPWYQFLRQIWLRVGGAVATVIFGTQTTKNVVTISLGPQAILTGTLDLDNNVLVTTPVAGNAPEILAPSSSPWVYVPTTQGTLIVFSGQLEIGRNGQWFTVGLTGGALPMLVGDSARVTWYGASKPGAVFLPGGA